MMNKVERKKSAIANLIIKEIKLSIKVDKKIAKWENEKQAISKVQKLREEIEQVNAQIEQAERVYDLGKVAELRYGKLPELQKELKAEEELSEKKFQGSKHQPEQTAQEKQMPERAAFRSSA